LWIRSQYFIQHLEVSQAAVGPLCNEIRMYKYFKRKARGVTRQRANWTSNLLAYEIGNSSFD